MSSSKKTLTAQNTFTDWVRVPAGVDGRLSERHLSISGTFSGTITVQTREGGADATIADLAGESYTAAAERVLSLSGGLEVRAGFKTGGYTSGSAVVRIA